MLLAEQPPSSTDLPSKLVILNNTAEHHPELVEKVIAQLGEKLVISLSLECFPNGMPLIRVPKLDQALLLSIIDGPNHAQAFFELVMTVGDFSHREVFMGKAATDEEVLTDKNAEEIWAFLVYVETRQDKRTRVQVPSTNGHSGERHQLIAQDQYVFPIHLAQALAAVGLHGVVTLDLHSERAAQAFEQAGIQVLNITAAPFFAEYFKKQGLLDGDLEIAVCALDWGDLNRAYFLSTYFGVDLATVDKLRIAIGDGTDSHTEHKFGE